MADKFPPSRHTRMQAAAQATSLQKQLAEAQAEAAGLRVRKAELEGQLEAQVRGGAGRGRGGTGGRGRIDGQSGTGFCEGVTETLPRIPKVLALATAQSTPQRFAQWIPGLYRTSFLPPPCRSAS